MIKHATPVQWLIGAAGLGLLVVLATLLLALRQPWLGLTLGWDHGAQQAQVLALPRPGLEVPVGAGVVALRAAEREQTLESLDFVVEPDGNLPTFADYRRFLARQHVLAQLLRQPALTLVGAQGEQWVVTPLRSRPVSSLPVDFWVQEGVALLSWLICASVWAFRRDDVSARYLLVSGFSTLMFASGAAVYTTRELAIGLPELYILKTMNFGGGLLYCITLAALLWHYPTRLGPTRVSIAMLLAMAGWYLFQEAGWVASMLVARRLPVLVAVLMAVLLAFVQWRHTRHDPLARAALRWFLLAWLVMTGMLALVIFVPQVHGVDTGPVQGYSFLLVLLVYVGLAFGILRYRLFELGEWWGRILSWMLGAALLVVLDLLLVYVLHLTPQVSLTLAVVLCGLIWLPLRNALWHRLFHRDTPDADNLFRDILDITHAPQREEGQRRWQGLLRHRFQPLDMKRLAAEQAPHQPAIGDDGLTLRVPASGDLPGWQLGYARQGRRLFHRHDVTAVSQLLDMLRHARESRDAYQRGVSEERSRIAQELHDNIGSHLLTALHHQDPQHSKAAVSQGIEEMQDIIRGLTGEAASLADVLADLRHETRLRAAAAGVALQWPLEDESCYDQLMLDYGQQRHYLAVVRELVSNILRHSGARQLGVTAQLDGGWLELRLCDDGRGFDGQGDPQGRGHGLSNLQQRVASCAAQLRYLARQPGTEAVLRWPLGPNTAGVTP